MLFSIHLLIWIVCFYCYHYHLQTYTFTTYVIPYNYLHTRGIYSFDR